MSHRDVNFYFLAAGENQTRLFLLATKIEARSEIYLGVGAAGTATDTTRVSRLSAISRGKSPCKKSSSNIIFYGLVFEDNFLDK